MKKAFKKDMDKLKNEIFNQAIVEAYDYFELMTKKEKDTYDFIMGETKELFQPLPFKKQKL